VDGTALNGSYLPALVTRGGELTPHWSILTALGDGLVYALGYDDAAAAERVREVGNEIRRSRIPGVLVLNLHPQNVTDTPQLHRAARALVDDGFHAWSLEQCVDWFAQRDGTQPPQRRVESLLRALRR